MGKAGHPTAQRTDLAVADPAAIRNVVLVGPSGAGKTTLVEHLLHATGGIERPGSVAGGTTTSDSSPQEREQERSVSVSVVPALHRGVKINLIDTPGYADFIGEVRAGLRAADCALFVVPAADGVDGPTRLLWEECTRVGMPRCVVISRLDAPRADLDAALASCRESFGEHVVTLTAPGPVGDDAAAVSSLLDPPTDPAAEQARGELLEAVIEESEDESLMERYLAGEQIDRKTLSDDLEKALAHGSLFPVVPVAATTGIGLDVLLDVIVDGFPPPADHPVPDTLDLDGAPAEVVCDPAGPLVAEVVRTTSDPYVGRISVVRVFSGTATAEQQVHVSGHLTSFFGERSGHADHDSDERIGTLAVVVGAQSHPVGQLVAGDIGAVTRLAVAETGDTLSDPAHPVVMHPWDLPEPVLAVALSARSKSDEDKLLPGLRRIVAEDPAVRVEQDPDTHQLVLWTMGETHCSVLVDRLAREHGAAVDTAEVAVPMRETLAGPGRGRGRHVKQSGGHGQFAICEIEVEPLPEGSGLEFVDKVVGGAVPRQFISSVERGIRTQMERGLSGPHTAVDLKVTLVDGKAHSVDSSDMAFQTAGALALRDAANNAGVRTLEPIDSTHITVDDEFVGTVMSDLSGRRARVLGTSTAADGRTTIEAEAPRVEMLRYAIDLRSLSHGTGTMTRTFVRYEPAPS